MGEKERTETVTVLLAGACQPIGMLGRSNGNHDWLLANASACVSCSFRLRNVRNARNASDCVWMETGLNVVQYFSINIVGVLWVQYTVIYCNTDSASSWQEHRKTCWRKPVTSLRVSVDSCRSLIQSVSICLRGWWPSPLPRSPFIVSARPRTSDHPPRAHLVRRGGSTAPGQLSCCWSSSSSAWTHTISGPTRWLRWTTLHRANSSVPTCDRTSYFVTSFVRLSNYRSSRLRLLSFSFWRSLR